MSGLQDERLMQSFLNQGDDLTFTRAVELANTLVLAKEQAKSLAQTQPQDSSQTGAESSSVHKVTQGQRRKRGKSSGGKARARNQSRNSNKDKQTDLNFVSIAIRLVMLRLCVGPNNLSVISVKRKDMLKQHVRN